MYMDKLRQRSKKIFEAAKAADVVLIANTSSRDPNFTYLTDFTSGLFERSIILLKRDGAKLLVYELEYEDAERQKPPGMEVVKLGPASAKDILQQELRGRTVGMNFESITHGSYLRIRKASKPAKIIDVSSALSEARLVKDDYEINLVKKAAHITKKAMEEIKSSFREGVTELEIAAKFDEISERLGSKGPSFSTIVCFGPNASIPHHSPDGTKLKYGDFILIDAGAKVGNYCSDISRTVIFGDDKSRISDYGKKLEMLDIVKEAQRKAIDAIREGVQASSIHNLADNIISTSAGGIYKGTFIHSLGHSLGIEVHDGKGLSPLSKYALKENMIVTVEPGIYISGFGGVRIEDDILVTKEGAIIL